MEMLQNLMIADADAILVMSIAIVCDMVTGVIKAVISHDLKSSVFKQGLLKKAYDYILVIIGCCLDYLMKTNVISIACLYCLIGMEFYSCVENLREYVPIPKALSNALDILQKKESEELKK